MTQQVLESIGKLTSDLKVWSSIAWASGDYVVHLNAIWKANANMLDWAKKVKPEVFERIRLAFADRKQQLLGAK